MANLKSGAQRASHPAMNQRSYRLNELLGQLNNIEEKNAPNQLYVAGDVDLLRAGRRVSVVGSRKVSDAGVKRARNLVKELIGQDIIVVSGLAAGVDAVAHETAMKLGGHTIAVLGTPLDTFYPAENKALQLKIMSEHAAVSQFPTGYPATPKNFPMRNRTMALLTDATVIVEASKKSGTQHQGWEALRLGRDVFIMDNVAEDKRLSWPQEMISYGAQKLARENLTFVLDNLPAYTDRKEVEAFAF